MDQFLQFVAGHPILFSALGVIIALLIANEVHGNLRGEKRLPPLDAVRLINDSDALIVDVRSPADYKRGHILNAVNIPAAKLPERARELGKDRARPVLVYCALGSSAAMLSEQIRKQGFETVYALKGGLNSWQAAGLPVTTK